MCDVTGWIKLHKKMLEWQWYNDNNVKLLFIHCLLKSNYIDKKWKGTVIKRGSFATSISHLSIELNLSQQQIKTALNKLILTNEINKRTTNGYTIITIVNYESYQKKGDIEQQTDNKQITNEQQTDNFQITTTKEIKNKRIKNINPIEIFSKTLFDIFLSEYKNSRNDDYVFTNKKTQINAIKKLIEFYNAKESNKGKTEEEKIIDFTNLFKQMININDAFHWERISLQYIVKYFQVLKNIIQKPKHETTKSVFNSRLNLTADDLEHSRNKFLRQYGVGEIADAN